MQQPSPSPTERAFLFVHTTSQHAPVKIVGYDTVRKRLLGYESRYLQYPIVFVDESEWSQASNHCWGDRDTVTVKNHRSLNPYPKIVRLQVGSSKFGNINAWHGENFGFVSRPY